MFGESVEMLAFQSSIADRMMHAVFLLDFLLLGAVNVQRPPVAKDDDSRFCSCTERQHLGSVPDHLSSVHTQQLASRVQPLCAQIQGENPKHDRENVKHLQNHPLKMFFSFWFYICS